MIIYGWILDFVTILGPFIFETIVDQHESPTLIRFVRRRKGTTVRAARLEKLKIQKDPQGRKSLGFPMPLHSLTHI